MAHANVCLLHATATGAEALKNLVLPGCGRFTIVDDGVVDMGDVGSNFFVTLAHVGQPRAKVVQEMLQEMNPDKEVVGSFLVRSVMDVVTTSPNFFTEFTVVLATQMTEAQVLQLEAVLLPLGIPFLVRVWLVVVYCQNGLFFP